MDIQEDSLYHFGVIGMKWGRRKAVNASAPKPQSQRQLNRIARDATIDKARSDYTSSARTNYKAAKAKYDVEKITIGRYEARKAFNAVKAKNASDYEVASQLKSGKERTQMVLGTIAGTILAVGAASLYEKAVNV